MKIYNLTMKVNRLELLKAQLGLELVAGTDEIEKFLEKELEGRTIEELEKQAGILGHSLVDNQRLVHSIVNASFYHATFSERIWANQSNLKYELDKILQTALIQGRNPREFIPRIRKAFDVSVNQAYRLLVTELARVQTDAQMKSFKKNGFDQFTFHALGTACDLCLELNGKHFNVEDGESGKNMPPMHPHCRCSTSAYMDDEDYEAWLDGYKEHGLTWEEWKGKLTNNKFVSNKLGNKKVFITEQAINKVKQVKFEGLSNSYKLQQLHKEILYKSMIENNSNEVLAIVDANDYDNKVITFGSERKVSPGENIKAVALMEKSKYQSVYWLHNHAFTSDFSYDDIGCFFDERVKAITIVTNKGKISVLNKMKNYEIKKFRDIILEERQKFENPIDHADELAKAILKRRGECGIQWIR